MRTGGCGLTGQKPLREHAIRAILPTRTPSAARARGPLPPVNPYPLQVPGTGNGMIPPPAAGQYAPQQQAAQPPVTSGNTQNPYANNNR